MGKPYIVGCRNCNAILERVPAHVQNLLVKINLIGIGLLSHPPTDTCRTPGSRSTLFARIRRIDGIDGGGDTNLLGFEGGLVGLKDNFRFFGWIGGINHEIIIVAPRHYILSITRKDHLKFVKYAVVLVCITQPRPKMLVYGDGLYGLSLHVDVPDFHGQIVAG